jgi:segregation and condensation protein B
MVFTGNRMSLKAKIEAIIYAAEEPVTVDQILAVIQDEIRSDEQNTSALAADESVTDGVEPHNEGPTAADDAGHPEPEMLAAPTQKSPEDLQKQQARQQRDRGRRRVREVIEQLIAEYDAADHGIEIRQVAGGYRMSTKPENHDAVRAFAKTLKPAIKLSLQALETLAVIAYKQPVTAPEISEIRGVDSSGVLASLISRKLITTAGRKAVIGRPILYKTTKDFLMRFGLKDVGELPSIEEFEKLTRAGENDLFPEGGLADATGVPDQPANENEQVSTADHAAHEDQYQQHDAVETTQSE